MSLTQSFFSSIQMNMAFFMLTMKTGVQGTSANDNTLVTAIVIIKSFVSDLLYFASIHEPIYGRLIYQLVSRVKSQIPCSSWDIQNSLFQFMFAFCKLSHLVIPFLSLNDKASFTWLIFSLATSTLTDNWQYNIV